MGGRELGNSLEPLSHTLSSHQHIRLRMEFGRSQGDGDRDDVRFVYLIEEGVDAENYALVCHWSDRAGGEELHAVVAFRDKVIAGNDGWVEWLSLLPYPVLQHSSCQGIFDICNWKLWSTGSSTRDYE